MFCVLYADSTLLWYDSQMAARPQGSVYLKVAPELIATGQVARRLFHVPNPPSSAASAYEHVIAIGERRRQRVHFFLADDQHALRYVTQLDFTRLWPLVPVTNADSPLWRLVSFSPRASCTTNPLIMNIRLPSIGGSAWLSAIVSTVSFSLEIALRC